MISTRPLLIALCAVALAVAGCGGDDEPESAGSGTATAEQSPATDAETATEPAGTGDSGAAASELEVSADPGGGLAYEQDSLTATAGSVLVKFSNEASTPHDVKVERDGEQIGGTDVISSSETEATLELEPGEYTFYCSVGGHRSAGMEGTLTVE